MDYNKSELLILFVRNKILINIVLGTFNENAFVYNDPTHVLGNFVDCEIDAGVACIPLLPNSNGPSPSSTTISIYAVRIESGKS